MTPKMILKVPLKLISKKTSKVALMTMMKAVTMVIMMTMLTILLIIAMLTKLTYMTVLTDSWTSENNKFWGTSGVVPIVVGRTFHFLWTSSCNPFLLALVLSQFFSCKLRSPVIVGWHKDGQSPMGLGPPIYSLNTLEMKLHYLIYMIFCMCL